VPKQKNDEFTVRVGEQVARLHRRTGTANWSFKVRTPSGAWKPYTAGTSDFAAAKEKARDHLTEIKVLLKHGMAPEVRKFGAVAAACIKVLEEERAVARRQSAAEDYIYALKSYHIPFFGSVNVGSIDGKMLAQFDDWRSEKLGRTPKKSTIQTHNAAMQRVFDHGLRQGWVKQWQVPTLTNHGAEGETRATFTPAEFDKLTAYLERWAGEGRNGISRQIRIVLREWVQFVALTGVRPGTETASIRWCDIRPDTVGNTPIIRIMISDGKTGRREIIAPAAAQECLDRLKAFNVNAKPDWPIFAILDGRYPGNHLCEGFRRVVEQDDLKLRHDSNGDVRTAYSLRHFYATEQRRRGLGYETLKNQMGTSVGMLEAHYDHVKTSDEAARIVGTLPPEAALGIGIKATGDSRRLVLVNGSIRLAS
jgi:integrase